MQQQERGEVVWEEQKSNPELFRYGRLFRSTSSHKARRAADGASNYELGICRFTEDMAGTG